MRTITRNLALFAAVPTVIVTAFLVALFLFVGHVEGYGPEVPWGFVGIAAALTALTGCGQAWVASEVTR